MELQKSLPKECSETRKQPTELTRGLSDSTDGNEDSDDEDDQEEEEMTAEEIAELKAQINREEEEDALNLAVGSSETIQPAPIKEEPVSMGRTRGRTAAASGYVRASISPGSSRRQDSSSYVSGSGEGNNDSKTSYNSASPAAQGLSSAQGGATGLPYRTDLALSPPLVHYPAGKPPTPRGSRGKWLQEEDELLREAVIKHSGRNWKKISEIMVGRTDVQCLHRWQKVLRYVYVRCCMLCIVCCFCFGLPANAILLLTLALTLTPTLSFSCH